MAFTEVILREKIKGLGAEADVVKVRRGYARNFLVPHGKAYEATKGNLRQLHGLQVSRAAREAEELQEAEQLASKVRRLKLQMDLQTGAGGKAFGSITVIDLAKELEERLGIEIDRHIILLDKPIKSTGSYDIPLKIHPDVKVDLRVRVESANASEANADEKGAE